MHVNYVLWGGGSMPPREKLVVISVGSMLSTCNKELLEKFNNDIHNNLSDCGFAVSGAIHCTCINMML